MIITRQFFHTRRQQDSSDTEREEEKNAEQWTSDPRKRRYLSDNRERKKERERERERLRKIASGFAPISLYFSADGLEEELVASSI